MKLSLNLPALERLLAGDTELEVELRHNIAKQFAKDHLAGVVNDETQKAIAGVKAQFSEVAKQIGKLADDEIKRQVGHYTGGGWSSSAYKANLTEQVAKLVSDVTYEGVKKSIDKHVGDLVDYYETRWRSHICKRVEEKFDQVIENLVNAEIGRRLKAAAEVK